MLRKIINFVEDLEKLEALLYELSVFEGLLMRIGGLSSVLRRNDIKHADEADAIFGKFSEKLAECLKIAPAVDRDIADNLKELINQTSIEILITQLGVRLKIERKGRYSNNQYKSILAPFFGVKPIPIFADKNLHLETVIVYVKRLKSLIKLLANEMANKAKGDDEIFKPSNIDINIIVTQIDLAIDSLFVSAAVNPSEKERLISYLQEAKIELASPTPAWKKIIGALVICATIISGVSDAPQAIESLNKAIKHILGTSIERTLPSLLPTKPNDDYDSMGSLLPTALT